MQVDEIFNTYMGQEFTRYRLSGKNSFVVWMFWMEPESITSLRRRLPVGR